jgi:hypothetical protein
VVKLTDRALCKDLLQMPRADLRQDLILDGLIQSASEDAERITRRKFGYQANIVEYHPSYDQGFNDPEPVFFIVDSFPLDPLVAPIVKWSNADHRADLQTTLDPANGDFTYDPEKGLFSIRYMGAATMTQPIIGGFQFSYAPRGFQVTYAGGYPVTEPPSSNDSPDPLDEYGVAQVPTGLKLIVAKKVAADYRALRPASNYFLRRGVLNVAVTAMETFRQDLTPYIKRDRLL